MMQETSGNVPEGCIGASDMSYGHQIGGLIVCSADVYKHEVGVGRVIAHKRGGPTDAHSGAFIYSLEKGGGQGETFGQKVVFTQLDHVIGEQQRTVEALRAGAL